MTQATEWKPSPEHPVRADLVLEGGGVRGIGHVGAMTALCEAGIVPNRIAGTSTGAIAGAAVASFLKDHGGSEQVSAEECEGYVTFLEELRQLYLSTDYQKLCDKTLLRKIFRIPHGEVVSIFFQNCEHKGEALHQFIGTQLTKLGVTDWSSLKIKEPGRADPTNPHNIYHLVVIAADVSRSLMLRLPWDLVRYGKKPHERMVADDVYASAAVPELFKPHKLEYTLDGKTHESLLVDGGLTSGFPVDTFDRQDGNPPRWPTFLVGLQELESRGIPPGDPPKWGVPYVKALIQTGAEGRDLRILEQHAHRLREILVPASFVDPDDFEFEAVDRAKLAGIMPEMPIFPAPPSDAKDRDAALHGLFEVGHHQAKSFIDKFRDSGGWPELPRHGGRSETGVGIRTTEDQMPGAALILAISTAEERA